MPRRESPLDEEDGTVAWFARDLRRLREQAGSPTYRQLSKLAHYSAAALSEAANGRKLPSLSVTIAYVRACDGDVAAWDERWRSVAEELAELNPRVAPESVDGRAPYIGLTAFQPDDADRFFGRSRLVRELVAKVDEHRLVVVFGASGSGKSSVLRAGLVAAALAREQPVVVCVPGAHPVRELAVRIAALTGKSAPSLNTEFAAYRENLHLRVRQSLVERQLDTDLLLVVDQFEEVFTLCRDPAERAAFIDALTTAANAETSRTKVVLGVRADFLGHCGQHPGLADALRSSHLLVGPMTSDELREAIVEPAAGTGCQVESALVTRLVLDAAAQPAVLPLVSHALLETWHRRRGLALTLAGYEEVGGVQHAIARTAEQVYLAFDDDRRRAAKQVFLRLIAVGEGTEDTKRRVELDEVTDPDVLAELADARLVTLDRDTVELAHEALIRNWPRLSAWIAEDRDGLRVRRALTEAAQGWESLDRDPGALYRGTRLALAREWAADRQTELTAREADFLDAGVEAEESVLRLGRRRTRRLRQLVGLLVVLLVVASSALVYAFRAERSATEQRNIAAARQVISEAATLRETNPALAAQLNLAAYRLAPLRASRDALLNTFVEPYATRLETGSVLAASPTRDLLATRDGANATQAVLWDISDPRRPVRLATLPVGYGMISAAAFSPDGGTLAVAYGDLAIRLWDVADPRAPKVRTSIDQVGNVESLSFAPGRRLLAAGTLAGVRLWDLADPGRPATLPGTEGLRTRAVFGAGNRLLTTGERPADVPKMWDVTDPHSPVELGALPWAGNENGVTASVFSPDGRLAAVSGWGPATRLWDVTDLANPRLVASLEQRTEVVTAVVFSPDSRVVAAAGIGGTVRLWDVADPAHPKEALVLEGHEGSVTGLAFARDGRTLVTSTEDQTVRLADVGTPLANRPPVPVSSIVLAADRPIAAAQWAGGGVRIFEVVDNRRLGRSFELGDHSVSVSAVSLRPDGRAAVVATYEGTVRVWDIADPARPKMIKTLRTSESGTDGVGVGAAFSPDGKFLATGGAKGAIDLWDATTFERVRELSSPRSGGDQIRVIRFDPTGRTLVAVRIVSGVDEWDLTDPGAPVLLDTSTFFVRDFGPLVLGPRQNLVTAGGEGVRFWPAPGPGLPADVGAVGGRVFALAGNSDGTIAIGGADGLVRLWSTTGQPSEFAVLSGYPDAVASLAYSSDDHTLVGTGNDGTVRFWETDPERVAARVCDTAFPRISQAEWGQHFPGLDYAPPCGS
jgi:WD40 repeat protein